MKFLIITNVNHIQKRNEYLGYAPYVTEMNIWLKYVDEVIILAPLKKNRITKIDSAYQHSKIDFRSVSNFSFTSFKNSFLSIFKIPFILWQLFWAMKDADHIHLRCPGNIGLLGCFVQILFPNKIKSAKYAGNWDPQSKQPWTYRLQKYILTNTFLSRNVQVLVYGDWENQSKNIRPFFTATYSESEKELITKKSLDQTIEFVFAGSLVEGKNPIYAVKLIEQLMKKGNKAVLNLYGEGNERDSLEKYIVANQLQNIVFLHGNQDKETLKKVYKKSHFVILPSKSEGWPKAIAEGMFWGCIPIATKVSCVPFMLDYGERGIVLRMNLEKDRDQIIDFLDEKLFLKISRRAADWSQYYTIEIFETELKKVLEK
ncbi:glycosyltransferase [Flavobacterium oncorhynchi]|uniref:glycosyltransferase n=1 Tax=Flavobacterium oncorhynchi TaxID=728056 RepID=UPI00351A1A91